MSFFKELTPLTAIDVVIPAFNEAESIGLVLGDISHLLVRRVVVADNNSTDATAQMAEASGAIVVPAPVQGYGSACQAGVKEVVRRGPPDILVFLDADYSDHPDEMEHLVAPILENKADVVIGSRVLGDAEPGSLLPQARFGNWLACWMIRVLYRHQYTDLGPFRAVRWSSYTQLGMRDPNFGWTAELQVKALKRGLRVTEVPVSYRKRVGVSKITGTVVGTVCAGYKIIRTILRYSLLPKGPATVAPTNKPAER